MTDAIEFGCTILGTRPAVVLVIDPEQLNDDWDSVLNVKISLEEAKELALDLLGAVEDAESALARHSDFAE